MRLSLLDRLSLIARSYSLADMAGLDFELTSRPDEDDLHLQLLQQMQLAARDLGLEVISEVEPATRWSGLFRRHTTFVVGVHGSYSAICALPYHCFSELDAIARSMPTPSSTRRQQILSAWCEGYRNALAELDQGFRAIAVELRSLEEEGWTFFSPASINFDAGPKNHLKPSLKDFRLALMQIHLNRITTRSLMEECHTTTEHVLDVFFRRKERRSLSYADKVDALTTRGIFDALTTSETAFATVPQELKELKDYRREAKHRGQTVDNKTALRLASAALVSVNFLLARIREDDQCRSKGKS
jgi:hypothetical protein